MHWKNNKLFIFSIFFENVSWEFNVNSFIAITIEVWTSLYKYWSQLL